MTTKNDFILLDLARQISKKSAKNRIGRQVGCVIANGSRIVTTGFNSLRTHPRFGSGFHRRLHAEGAAIYAAIRTGRGDDIIGATAYVCRGNNRLAAPCRDCQRLLDAYGIERVVYSR